MLVYLSGGMSGLNYDEQLAWRNKFIKSMLFRTGANVDVKFFQSSVILFT